MSRGGAPEEELVAVEGSCPDRGQPLYQNISTAEALAQRAAKADSVTSFIVSEEHQQTDISKGPRTMTSRVDNADTPMVVEEGTDLEDNAIKKEEDTPQELLPPPPEDDELGRGELCAHWLEKEGNSLPPPSSALVDQVPVEEPLLHPAEPKCTLKGIVEDNGTLTGSWAMTQEAHSDPSQTSRFEYQRKPGASTLSLSSHTSNPHTAALELSGDFTGHFFLQIPGKTDPVKINEKSMSLEFVLNTAGNFNIHGSGDNQYGSFKIEGTCNADGTDFIVYRTYQPPTAKKPVKRSVKVEVPPEPGAPPPRRQSGKDLSRVQAALQVASVRPTEKQRSGRAATGAKTKRAAAAAASTTAPKQKLESKEIAASSSKRSSARPRKTPSHLSGVPSDQQPNSAIQALPEVMRKCHGVIGLLERMAGAQWFMSAVDPVALGVLHYRSIVTSPMDLGTVKRRIEQGHITDIHAFTAEIRLIFRNALTFNVLPEAPVHEAARDLLEKFEEAIQNVWKQLSSGSGLSKKRRGDHADVDDDSSGGGLSSKRARNGTKGKGMASGKKGAKSAAKRGPRYSDDDDESRVSPLENEGMVPISEFIKIQKQMKKMQETIEALQRDQAQTEVQLQTNMEIAAAASSGKPNAAARRAAKKKLPLTFEEKQQLSHNINNLPPEKLGHVVKIVQDHMDLSTAGDDEIEIDIETLDTATLRHLQSYVKSSLAAAKRKASAGTGSGRPPKQSKQSKQQASELPALATAPDPMLEEIAFGTDFADGGEDDDDLAFALDA